MVKAILRISIKEYKIWSYEKDKNNLVFDVVRYFEFFNIWMNSKKSNKFNSPLTIVKHLKKPLTMKSLKIIVMFFVFALFSVQGSFAQDVKKAETEIHKTTKEKTPKKVKESLKDYSNYKIANEVTYVRKKDINIYKFKVEKGTWSHYLLINESGKIIGIETGEH